MDGYGQFETFIYTLITGIILGIVFDCYRVMRRALRPHIWITSLTDLLYWLIATLLVFITLIIGNWGEVRLYVFIGLLIGVTTYYRFASRAVIWLIIRAIYTIRLFVNRVCNLLTICLWPIKQIVCVISKPVCYLVKIIKSISHDKSPPQN